MAKANTVTINLTPEKITKNTVRFSEQLESEFAAPTIGTIYVPKATLGQLGYSNGDHLVLTLAIGGDK